MYTIHRIDRHSHMQQFGISPILISGPTGPVLHQCGLSVGKTPFVKADLSIYSHLGDVSGQCISVS